MTKKQKEALRVFLLETATWSTGLSWVESDVRKRDQVGALNLGANEIKQAVDRFLTAINK